MYVCTYVAAVMDASFLPCFATQTHTRTQGAWKVTYVLKQFRSQTLTHEAYLFPGREDREKSRHVVCVAIWHNIEEAYCVYVCVYVRRELYVYVYLYFMLCSLYMHVQTHMHPHTNAYMQRKNVSRWQDSPGGANGVRCLHTCMSDSLHLCSLHVNVCRSQYRCSIGQKYIN